MKNCYKDWGFISNPFKTTPLNADGQGLELLVGRDKEKSKLINRIKSDSGIVTIEGENGIGKTSIVNAATYELYEDSIQSNSTELYIPCLTHFQLSKGINKQEFIDDIYFAIAQTLIQKAEHTKKIRRKIPNTKSLDAWLNATEIISISAQIASFGGGENRALNSTEGYLRSGFKKEITNWLKKIFPTSDSGGITCMIDNLELLTSSKLAREILEVLRDELINIVGTKWIFSGSHGIIRSITGSPRLSGFLLNPIKLNALGSIFIPSILSTRVNSYQNSVDKKPYVPISEEGFVVLYNSLNGNLRDTLKKIASYCLFAYESEKKPYFNSEKDEVFENWLNHDMHDEYHAIKTLVSDRELKLLKLMIESEEPITISGLQRIGFKKIDETISSIDKLKIAGLISIPIFQVDEIQEIFENKGHFTLEVVNKEDEIPLGKFDSIFANILVAPKGVFIYEKI